MFKILKALKLWFTELTLEEKQIVVEYYHINKEIKSMAAKYSDVLAELVKRATERDKLAAKEVELQKTIDDLTVELTAKTDRLAELEPLVTELEKAESDLGIVIPEEANATVPPAPAATPAPETNDSNIVPPVSAQ